MLLENQVDSGEYFKHNYQIDNATKHSQIDNKYYYTNCNTIDTKGSILKTEDSEKYAKETSNNEKSSKTRPLPETALSATTNQNRKEKKFVRFADALGLELTKIKIIENVAQPNYNCYFSVLLNNLRISKIDENPYELLNKYQLKDQPKTNISSKFCQYKIEKKFKLNPQLCGELQLSSDSLFKIKNCEHSLKWKQCFEQPGIMPCFFKNLNEKKISLETVHMKSHLISGVVRVSNICFNKVVKIRYTTDKWKTHSDINAAYVNNSCDGLTDRFSFNLNLENNLSKFFNNSQNFYNTFHIEFAIAYETDFNNSSLFWDNNSGSNYKFEVCMKKFKFKC